MTSQIFGHCVPDAMPKKLGAKPAVRTKSATDSRLKACGVLARCQVPYGWRVALFKRFFVNLPFGNSPRAAAELAFPRIGGQASNHD
jgi:hypothetical protein